MHMAFDCLARCRPKAGPWPRKSVWLVLIVALVSLVSSSALPAPDGAGLLSFSPLLAKPTASSIVVNIVAADAAIVCSVRYRPDTAGSKDSWKETAPTVVNPFSAASVRIDALHPDTGYEYQVLARPMGQGMGRDQMGKQMEGRFRTQKTGNGGFSFAIFSDMHITPFDLDRQNVLRRISASVERREPDFTLMLGDNIQTYVSHGGPLGDPSQGPQLYMHLRRALGSLPSQVPLFSAIGNWEGENGWHGARQREWARDARTAFLPNPDSTTFPEGGSPYQDYYGFTWGDALFVVLNPLSYTTTDHTHQKGPGRADEWTLGEAQKKWVYELLSKSKARWKLLFMHHPVGGNAGNELNSRYGRGGGRAARIGEQALLHSWMKQFGVQALFYGHDHVFTDMAVDGIHYVCVGSAGAPWKFETAETGYEKYWAPSGYTLVDVTTRELKVSFISPDEKTSQDVLLHSFVIPANR